MNSDESQLLAQRRNKVIEILEAATPLLLEGYSPTPGADSMRTKLLGIETKSSPKDLVTVFDKRVEDFIISELAREFKGEKIIGEESTAATHIAPLKQAESLSSFWLIDPIDGTTNYSRAYPFFCSTISFVEKRNSKWIPVVAATWNPVSKEMFSASLGGGAWLNGARLKVSNTSELQNCLLTTGFASERSMSGNLSFQLFEEITKATLGVRRDGSAALDLAYVAAGRIDAYWEWGLAPWDIAAGLLLVSEAGGLISGLRVDEVDLFNGEIIAANNGFLHKWLQNKIRSKVNESA